MKKLLLWVVACAFAAFHVAAQTGTNTNLSGTWQIEYHDNNGKEVDMPMVSFVQSGGKLEGVFGDKHWKVEGLLAGDDIKFWFTPPMRRDVTVRYQGRLENANLMRGTMVSEVQSGSFVAVRKQ